MDKTHVCEIMLNLISNSIKYTPDGGTIKVAIRDLPGDDDSHCIVESTFENTGIGMSEKFLAYAFEIFSREHTTENIITNTPITDNKQFKGMRILLAEDNVLNTEIAIDILSDEGFTVDNVGDGLACVDKLQSSPAKTYDLILMDIQMPVMDGYKATETIRALPDPELANIPIIAMTANAFKEDIDKAISVGMNGKRAYLSTGRIIAFIIPAGIFFSLIACTKTTIAKASKTAYKRSRKPCIVQ